MINTQALQESRGKARLDQMNTGLKRSTTLSGSTFQSLLDGVLGKSAPLKFSAHAQERLESRGIALGTGEIQRLQQAMDDAAAKGGRDAVLLTDGLAFIVSIPNRTVITALSRQDAGNQVFTKIDTAVMVPNVTASDTFNTGWTPKGEASMSLNEGRGILNGGNK